MVYAINYANEKYQKAQKLNTKTAYKCGVDKVYSFSEKDIDDSFRKRNESILTAERGNGYWLWKPYFINKVMKIIEEGDILIYSDAGLFFLNNVNDIIQKMNDHHAWLVCQNTGFMTYQYTKRDTFVYMGMDEPKYVQAPQRNGVMIFKKNENSISLVREWLKFCQDVRIISDMPNTCGFDNYNGFLDHRHDQSVFSLLSWKYGALETTLFEPFEKRKSSKALLCYHHTVYGNRVEIFIRRFTDPCWWKIKRIVKKILKRKG